MESIECGGSKEGLCQEGKDGQLNLGNFEFERDVKEGFELNTQKGHVSEIGTSCCHPFMTRDPGRKTYQLNKKEVREV